MKPVGNGFDHGFQKGRGYWSVGLLMQLGESELRCSVDRDEKVQLSLFGTGLGDIDMEIPNRIGLKLLLIRLAAGDIR